jgi:hypothetical protein
MNRQPPPIRTNLLPNHGLAFMKRLIAVGSLVASFCAAASEPQLPIQSGRHTFQHRFAEQPKMKSVSLNAEIRGRHIVLINEAPSSVFPKGVVAEGTLMWHSTSGQWIIGKSDSDRNAKEAGGCSDGPEVVDLKNKIYWTC